MHNTRWILCIYMHITLDWGLLCVLCTLYKFVCVLKRFSFVGKFHHSTTITVAIQHQHHISTYHVRNEYCETMGWFSYYYYNQKKEKRQSKCTLVYTKMYKSAREPRFSVQCKREIAELRKKLFQPWQTFTYIYTDIYTY